MSAKDILNFDPDLNYFQEFLKRIIKNIGPKYKFGKNLPDSLQKAFYIRNTITGNGSYPTNFLIEKLFFQCKKNLGNKNFLIVLNSIWPLFEVTIIELIVRSEFRGEKVKSEKTLDQSKFLTNTYSELEKKMPDELLEILLIRNLITGDEYKDLKGIKKYVRNTCSHTKILKLIKDFVKAGLIKENIPVLKGGENDLKQLMKVDISGLKLDYLKADGEILFQPFYDSVAEILSGYLFVYYYDFLIRNEEKFAI